MTLVNAEDFTRALEGEWHEHHGEAPCPVCQPERRPDQRGLLLRDWAEVDGLMLLCRDEGCSSAEIMKALHQLQRYRGDFDESYRGGAPEGPSAWAARREKMRHEDALVRWIWDGAQPIEGTPAEARLRAMGITGPLPKVLRFHPGAWHPYGAPRPAMVALTGGGYLPGIHLTYLAPESSGEALPDPAEAFVGHTGHAVEIFEPSPGAEVPLVVTESIETALRLASGLIHKPVRIWAALSPEGLKELQLPAPFKYWNPHPPEPGQLSITWDGGVDSRRAAHILAHRARALNWKVDFLAAPEGWAWADIQGGHLGLLPRVLLPADVVSRLGEGSNPTKSEPEPQPGLTDLDPDIPF